MAGAATEPLGCPLAARDGGGVGLVWRDPHILAAREQQCGHQGNTHPHLYLRASDRGTAGTAKCSDGVRKSVPVLLLAAILTGCGGESGGNPAFTESGQVIALGGGDGGPTHACASCHGLKGEGDGRLVPRLAGLDAGYLHRQLDDYANGRREHAEMRAVVRRLSMEDRAKVSAYYATLPANAAALPRTSPLYTAKCAECHGPVGEGVGPGNPRLAGQSAAYIEAQLLAWRAGKRRGDGMGEMLAVSRALAPAEVRALANLHQESLAAVPPASPRRPPAPAASR